MEMLENLSLFLVFALIGMEMAAVHAKLPRVNKMTVILCKTQTLLGQHDELKGSGEWCHLELPNTGLNNKTHALKKSEIYVIYLKCIFM